MQQLTEQQAQQIYDILVEVCEAQEYWRSDFVQHMTAGCGEYRFQGSLGFGGKLYNDCKIRVDCYLEDRNPKRMRVLEEANRRIDELLGEARTAKGPLAGG